MMRSVFIKDGDEWIITKGFIKVKKGDVIKIDRLDNDSYRVLCDPYKNEDGILVLDADKVEE